MPTSRILPVLEQTLAEFQASGRLKGPETVIVAEIAPAAGKGPRYLLAGEGERQFLRMNSNGYLGLAAHAALRHAEEEAADRLGSGPGAVRFISGTWEPHVVLERRLAAFHGREDVILFSSAYSAVMGTLAPLVTARTAVISDALNHNCIINAIALARPRRKAIHAHLDLAELERHLQEAAGDCDRALIVTDGVFSMRGDHAPLARIMEIAERYDDRFPENVIVMVDDSHGVGAFGRSGRGTEEVEGGRPADVLIGTLGKAFGVNGGYVAAAAPLVRYLRETSPLYIYSNPITQAEAAAAIAAVTIVDSGEGRALLANLRAMTQRFREGLRKLGLETVEGEHPVVPLLVRDGPTTADLVRHLREHGVLATAIAYPVVPRGEEEIRFQIAATHTSADVDFVLDALGQFRVRRMDTPGPVS